MPSVNSYVVYGTSGACRVSDICTRNIGMGDRQYYVLTPVFGEHSTFYVPTDNPAGIGMLRKTMTSEEVDRFIKSMSAEPFDWEPDNRKRHDLYTQTFRACDPRELLRLIRALYHQKQERAKAGKKLGIADENAMSKAQYVLHSEIALALGLELDQVVDYIKKQIEK